MLSRMEKTKKQNKIQDNSLQAITGKSFIPKNVYHSGGKASLAASRAGRASLTVECSMVLTLFFLCLCTLFSFMDIYRLQTEHLVKLWDRGKKASMYAYATGTTQDIVLADVYTYKNPISVFPVPQKIMTNQIRLRPWTGYMAPEGEEANGEEMVWVTASGGVYHTDANCSYLRLSTHAVSGSEIDELRNADGERYSPCESCSRGAAPATVVYVTDQGNRYHNLATCSRLKRDARLVKKSETGGMRQCSRCQERGS